MIITIYVHLGDFLNLLVYYVHLYVQKRIVYLESKTLVEYYLIFQLKLSQDSYYLRQYESIGLVWYQNA